MKQPWLVITFAALMLSACGNKSEVESSTAKAPPSATEQNTPVASDQAMQLATEEKLPGNTANSVKPSNSTSSEPALSREEGLALAGKSGCLACHKIDTKLVGPAWRDVSKRYKGDPDAKARLVAKVKTGGKGNWTEVTGGVPMPPNSPRVSDENIEKLVTFVLAQ